MVTGRRSRQRVPTVTRPTRRQVYPRSLDAGADRDAPSPLGDRPIHLAAIYGWIPVLETLVAAGADVGSRTVPIADAVWRMSSPEGAEHAGGLTPAMVAAREGGVDALRWFLARGADANARDDRGSTPLHVSGASMVGRETRTGIDPACGGG